MPHFFHEKFDFVEFAVLGREMNFWKCSKGDLGVCGLADLRSEETTHDDGAVAGIEALLIAIYFVKKIAQVRAAAPRGRESCTRCMRAPLQ